MCASASFICSCGTEFTEYKDMQEHSTTHEPGHQVLDHETIRKRRIERHIEEEEKLKRLQKGEVVWKTPRFDNGPSVSMPVKSFMPGPKTSPYMSQVPDFYPTLSQACLLPTPPPSSVDMQNIFAGVGAPTVDLWTLYQPVVLLQTMCKFNKKQPYNCSKCGQFFSTKATLVSHHSSHVTDKISGCIGCGLLLSSKKLVPRFHICNSPNNANKFRLITARPLISINQNQARVVEKQNQRAQELQANSSLQLNNITLAKRIQTSHSTSTLLVKKQNMRTYRSNNQGLPDTHYVKFKKPVKSTSGELQKMLSDSNEFTCRVCHIPFESAQLLQRHKCVKAKEFMAQHMRVRRQQYNRIVPVRIPSPAQMNGESKLLVPPCGSIKNNQVMAVSLDQGQGVVPVNGKTEAGMDEDCYIVESGPGKPAEMIYQVTSSVPIKI